jgi:hypothetical protein
MEIEGPMPTQPIIMIVLYDIIKVNIMHKAKQLELAIHLLVGIQKQMALAIRYEIQLELVQQMVVTGLELALAQHGKELLLL